MATYGLNREELAQIIKDVINRMPSDNEGGIATVLGYAISGVAKAIEQNNAKLAEQIIAELRGSDTL